MFHICNANANSYYGEIGICFIQERDARMLQKYALHYNCLNPETFLKILIYSDNQQRMIT